MDNAKYRLLQNGNGHFYSQVWEVDTSEVNQGRWIYFADLGDCETVEAAEQNLQYHIRQHNTEVIETYDRFGNRLPKTDYQG